MNHQLLLISSDLDLAERIRWALPPTLALELHCAPAYCAASDRRGWLLVLQDAAAGGGPEPGPGAPVLRIGPAGGACGHRNHGGIADYVERTITPAKLAFILHQHLAAAYLRRMRRLGEEPSPASGAAGSPAGLAELQGRLNNLLAGILGNAELAHEAGRRLQPPVARRLERIRELAAEMRPLLLTLSAGGPPKVRPDYDAAA